MEPETTAGHPARLPDPHRVQEWRKYIEVVHQDVCELLWWREAQERFAHFVRSNDHILHGQSDFPKLVRQWYRDATCASIRRLVDQGSEGPVYSLRLLLESMKRFCEAFTRHSVDSLLDEPGAPTYDPMLRTFLVDSLWEQFKDPKEGTDRLFSQNLKTDLARLVQSSGRIKEYADLRIAHHSLYELPTGEGLTWAELNECVDVIHDITKRWIAPLTGAGYSTLLPVFQGNWYDIFANTPKRRESA